MVPGCFILSALQAPNAPKGSCLNLHDAEHFSHTAGPRRMDSSHLSQAGSQARKETIALPLKIHSHEDGNHSTLFGQKVRLCPRGADRGEGSHRSGCLGHAVHAGLCPLQAEDRGPVASESSWEARLPVCSHRPSSGGLWGSQGTH